MSISTEITRVMLSPLLWIIVVGVMIIFGFGALWVKSFASLAWTGRVAVPTLIVNLPLG